MKQFGKIFSFEFRYYLKNKVFVGVTVFLVLAIAAVMFFPRISEALTNDDVASEIYTDDDGDGTAASELPVMLIKSDDTEVSDTIVEMFSAAFTDYEVKMTDDEIESITDGIAAGEAECAFIMKSDTSYTYYVNDLSMYDSNTDVADEALRQLYQIRLMTEGGMTPEQAVEVMSVQIEGDTVNLGTDQFQNFFYTYIMIFALYMVILLYGQMVATNVATEKSSRAMELLITSAKPASMMFGKVLASCLAGLIQLVAVFGSALLCFNLNRSYWGENMIASSVFDMPVGLFGYMLVFFVLGFLVYAFMYGAIGSTASRLEDINTSVMPITMLFIVAFVVVMYSLGAGTVDNTMMIICSYIPFTSPMAMFTRICMSVVPWYEILISIVILGASVVGIGFISAKIYRVGVLLYGKAPSPASLLGSIWKA